MGYYINPKNKTKEQWLTDNAVHQSRKPLEHDSEQDLWPVCWIDNGLFTAVGICFSKRELNEFKRDDGRAKVWFLVHKDKLAEFIPLSELKWN